MFELLLNVRHERLYIAGIGHKRSLCTDKDVDVSTLDFLTIVTKWWPWHLFVSPFITKMSKETHESPEFHASSRVLPGDDAIRSAYHNLEEVRPAETDRFEWSHWHQYLGTLEPKKVTQLNSKTWENSCSRCLDSFFMWFLGDVQVQNVSFLDLLKAKNLMNDMKKKAPEPGSFSWTAKVWLCRVFLGKKLHLTSIARWWQLKYFGYFHPENWGRFPIRLILISDGLVQPPTRSGLRVYFTKETG